MYLRKLENNKLYIAPNSDNIMGRIKSALIKRTSEKLVEQEDEKFNGTFDKNKKILGATMPSKRMRNKIAGYITRLKRNQKSHAKSLQT